MAPSRQVFVEAASSRKKDLWENTTRTCQRL